ncbi:hypothetical protein GCM10010278_15570 [Streptomyces melanogenes]|nr:hypothetical protein GCM10010278_15570 [Streptomyces melanogenes]
MLACAATALCPTGATASAAPPGSAGADGPAAAAPASSGVLFDAFHYSDSKDQKLTDHGWTVRDEVGGPGPDVDPKWAPKWDASAVTFPADSSAQGGRAMRLRATTDGTFAGTSVAQINTTRSKFFTGTYAARVHFNDQPTAGTAEGEHPVQTFYAISPSDRMKGENQNYSELDFEYLPKGGWGTTGHSLFTTAWRNPDTNDKFPLKNANAATSLQGWHTLQMTVANDTVVFYVDGRRYSSMDATKSRFSPREPMTLNFNEWFAEQLPTGASRTWEQKVNWVYYNESGALTPDQVGAAVDGYYANGIDFVDTVAEKAVPAPQETAAHDYNGDGVSDVSLLYDYGTTGSSSCGRSGTKHTAMFGLAGKADRSGGLGGIVPQWDSLCETASPKFVTSGDYNGDGQSDIAAFYEYGKTSPTCRGGDPVAVAIRVWLANPDGSGTLPIPRTVWESDCWGSGTKYLNSGDFNGDGKTDLALLYDYTAGHVRLFTLTADSKGNATFGGAVSRWDATNWGTGTKYLTTGDYNGDHKTDIALFYDHGTAGATCAGNAHQSVSIFTADPNGTGNLHNPTKVWESLCWGAGTTTMNSGDFNGDGKSDLALLYDYTAGHVRLFTLSANSNGDGAFGGVVSRWDATNWGTGTKYLTTGDYNGDHKTDIALFYDHGTAGATCAGNAHQSVSIFTADPNGTGNLRNPAKAWESLCWGSGTTTMN